MGQKEELVARLFSAAEASWKEYNEARKDGEIEKMRSAFDNIVKCLRVVHKTGYSKEAEQFLHENKMPVRAILKKMSE